MIDLLDPGRLERTTAWGGASAAMAYVHRPATVAALKQLVLDASRAGVPVAFRGGGYSYGDAPLNAERVLIDLSRMTRVLAWDPESGQITVEPGVTIGQLWRYCLGDGWWPAVVPGTMFPTVGGCLGMNVHGKNNWRVGTFGDNTLGFEALLANGDEISCSRTQHPELFWSMIGGMGLIGCFTSITLQLHRVHSGQLRVRSMTAPNIEAMIELMEAQRDQADYLVGWVDGISGGASLGRGQIHTADYLEPGEDPSPAQSLRLESQDLPDTFFGVMPKSVMWRFMRPLMNNLGARWVNRGRYWSARLAGDHTFSQSLSAFSFLLDYVPNWKQAYQPDGLVQFQCFIPRAQAAPVIRMLLQRTQQARLPTYLGVLKRHRPDEFLLSHAVDGFSMAMDFRVRANRRRELLGMLQRLEKDVLAAGGRFYFAKDSSLTPESVQQFLGEESLRELIDLKHKWDPGNLFQTNLSRRLLPQLAGKAGVENNRPGAQAVYAADAPLGSR